MFLQKTNEIQNTAQFDRVSSTVYQAVALAANKHFESFDDFFLTLFGEKPHQSVSGKSYVKIKGTNYRINFDDVFDLLGGYPVPVKERNFEGYYIPKGEKKLVEILPAHL